MSELIDIVDDNDHVIGQMGREEARAQGKRRRYVTVWVINSEGDLLLQWRTYRKKHGPREFDCSVGGGLLAGESYEQGVKREMKEELGIESDNLTFLGVLDDKVANANAGFFVVEHDGPYTNWEEEADVIDFVSFDELKFLKERFPYLLTPGLKLCFEHYVEMQEEELKKENV